MILLTDEWNKSNMARAVPGAYWDTGTKHFVLDAPTPRSAAVVLKLFPDVGQRHPELAVLRDELLADVRPFDRATPFDTRIHAPRVQAVLDKKGWDLHEYQALDLGYAEAVLRVHGGFYVGWDRGLGKTLGTCCLIDSLDAQRTLVVAPNTAKQTVWAEALEMFCPWAEVIVLPNAKAARERTLARVLDHRKRCHTPLVLVIHYEALALIAGKAKKGQLGDGWQKYGTWDLFAADEAHRLANPKALMSRAAKKVPSTYRLALSGSIIQNNLAEIFSPLQWLFPDTYKSAWRDWNDRFLDYVEGGYGKICLGVKPHMVEAMRTELGGIMCYRRKQDELDLPACVEQDLRVELSAKQRKAYNELVETCIATLDDDTKIKADSGAPMMNKLRQVATGLGLVSDELTDSTKLDLAVDLIMDAADDDFVVFSWYKAPVNELAQRLEAKGVGCFVVTGDTPHSERAESFARFQAGEGRVVIGTLATMGESVNLQRANNVIFLDRSFNPALNGQARDRVDRQGQTRTTLITHIIAKDTVDELNVLPTLANKAALRAAILGGV